MGLEGIGVALIIYYLVLLITGVAAMAIVAGIICLSLHEKKLGIFLITPSTVILSIVFGLWLNSLPKRHMVFLDLTKPLETQGIPRDAHWLKQHDYFLGDYSICEVDGKVSLTVILPDGKKIEEKVNSIIANYGTNGFYGIQIDNYKPMNSDQAIARIHAEAQKWSVGAKNTDMILKEEEGVKDWIMGHPRDGESYFADIYCEQNKYAIASEAMHNSFHLDQFIWRYQITMAWELDARAKQFPK